MPRGLTPDDEAKAERYVKAQLVGKPPSEARAIAGYSKNTKIADIERPGGPVSQVANRMVEALKRRGIDEDKIADEYAIGLEGARSGPEPDYQAHSKYLLQLGYLKGYGRNGPSVAVQINNHAAAPGREADEPGSVAEAVGAIRVQLAELAEHLGVVRAELGARGAPAVHVEGDPVAGGDQLRPGAGAHPGVGGPGGDA